jgi:hypothetical protein
MALLNDFESITFNFFEVNRFSSDENIDPDDNFFCDTFTDCAYFYPKDLKGVLFQNAINKSSNRIRILHLNIRSLNRNFEKLLNFLEET